MTLTPLYNVMRASLAAAALLPATLFSQTAVRTYSLTDCLSRALESNYGVKLVRSEAAVAANNATRAAAGQLPVVDLTAGYDGSLNSTSTRTRATGETVKTNGALDHTLSAGIKLGWTIFDGFALTADYARLQELRLKGETQTRLAMEDLAAQLSAEYFNLVQQLRRSRNYAEAMALSREHLRIAAERFSIGNASRPEYLQARVDFNADSTLWMKQEEVVTASRIRLAEMMAAENLAELFVPADTAIYVLPRATESAGGNFASPPSAFESDEALWRQILERNAELLNAEHDNRLSALDYKKACARDYPYLKLNASLGVTHNRYELAATDRRTTFGPAVGLTLGFRLFDGNRRRERRNAREAVEQSRLVKRQLELSLRSDLTTLWQAYNNNRRLVALERENVCVARENHSIAAERYRLGELSGLELREARQSLLNAEESLLRALYDTKVCEISLRQLAGELAVK